MKYLLTEEEYNELSGRYPREKIDPLLADLRAIILRNAKFKCYRDLTPEEQEKTYVDDGYCDTCPLSFCKNKEMSSKYQLCDSKYHLYSK